MRSPLRFLALLAALAIPTIEALGGCNDNYQTPFVTPPGDMANTATDPGEKFYIKRYARDACRGGVACSQDSDCLSELCPGGSKPWGLCMGQVAGAGYCFYVGVR